MLELKIKPSNALKKSVATISYISNYAEICSPTSIYLEAVTNLQGEHTRRIVAILRINVGTVDCFQCTIAGEAGLDPKELYRALDNANTDDWSVVVFNDHASDLATFVFTNPLIGAFKYDELQLLHEYKSVVGIPSLEFIRILTHFNYHRGEIVEERVTEKRVTFTSDGEKFVHKKKQQQCIIGGVDGPFTIALDLGYMPLYSNAAAQTPTIWLLKAAKIDNLAMLNIPVGGFLGDSKVQERVEQLDSKVTDADVDTDSGESGVSDGASNAESDGSIEVVPEENDDQDEDDGEEQDDQGGDGSGDDGDGDEDGQEGDVEEEPEQIDLLISKDQVVSLISNRRDPPDMPETDFSRQLGQLLTIFAPTNEAERDLGELIHIELGRQALYPGGHEDLLPIYNAAQAQFPISREAFVHALENAVIPFLQRYQAKVAAEDLAWRNMRRRERGGRD